MSRPLTAVLVLLLAGCAAEEPPPPPPPPPPPTFAGFAGDWIVTAVLAGRAEPVHGVIGSNSAGTAWNLSLEGRDPINLEPALHGDSLILTSGKYPSILRDNAMVQDRMAFVRSDAGLTGKAVFLYDTPDGQEIVTGTVEAVAGP